MMGEFNNMNSNRKEVVIVSHVNLERDLVSLVDKYIGLCPPLYSKPNFYIKALAKPTPTQWNGCQVLGEKSIGKILPDLMEEAGYTGYYTGHSPRRSGTTQLFRAGVQRKLIKETSGHKSDAVDQYQVTSNEQKCSISKILQGRHSVQETFPSSVTPLVANALETKISLDLEENSKTKIIKCKCTTNNPQTSAEVKDSKGSIVKQVMCNLTPGGKAKIRIEIEVSKD